MRNVSIKEITDFLQERDIEFSVEGDKDVSIQGFCSLKNPQNNCVTWVKKVDNELLPSFIEMYSGIIISPSTLSDIPNNKNVVIVTATPKKCFFEIVEKFYGNNIERGVAKTAIVEGKIGENCCIGERSYIGKEVSIGNNTIIEPGVSILNKVTIGDNCIIHSGAVIGGDGFGYYFDDDDTIHKVHHYGGVYIGNDVEVGANTCIDRGTIDDTTIGDNCKIDNLVHIAHNVVMEQSVAISANAIICGSAYLAKGVYVAPGGIVKNQVRVEGRGFVGIGSVVLNKVSEESVVVGVPAKEIRKYKKGDK